MERKRNKNGKSKLVNPMANMVEITTNRPIGRIRSKEEVTGSGKSKKRGSKLNGLEWQE